MSVHADTKQYAIEVAETALNAFEKQARGTLEAPSGADNVRLYTAKGGSAVTLGTGVTSAAVVYDPEASMRNGQMNVLVYGRNSSNEVLEVQKVNLGRKTSEFLSAGLLSSGMKVFNSSGVDVIGGTQTAAVLTSVPRDISKITSTDVANFCPNHDRDLASGVISREDATLTMAMTEHLGGKMALTRVNTAGNIVERSWDTSLGNRRTTVGQALGPVVNTSVTVANTVPADSVLLNDPPNSDNRIVVDTDLLSEENNPLSLATYRGKIEANIVFGDPDLPNLASQEITFIAFALDAAGGVLARSSQVTYTPRTDQVNAQSGLMSVELSSTTLPIARMVLSVSSTYADSTTDLFVPSLSTCKVIAYEETSDIPTRPIHVCVLEGVNQLATININTVSVMTGVPDSTNVFIGTAADPDPTVFDTNAVELFLRSLTKSMPRAFTLSGHAQMTKTVTALYGTEPIDVAFKAMSFGQVAKTVTALGKKVKAGVKDALKALEEAEPMVRSAGSAMARLPGTPGMIGSAVVDGVDLIRASR